jgi:hypothetical protein
MRTDRRLWSLFGGLAFVLLGFVRLWPPGVDNKVGPGYYWGVVFGPPAYWGWWHYGLTVVGAAAVLAVPAVVLGWAAQAVVVTIRAATDKPKNENAAD